VTYFKVLSNAHSLPEGTQGNQKETVRTDGLREENQSGDFQKWKQKLLTTKRGVLSSRFMPF
jgi:hypothetical protein